MEASRSQFACANPEKSAKTKQRLARIITEEEQKLQFNRSKAMPAPPRKIVRTTQCCFMRCLHVLHCGMNIFMCCIVGETSSCVALWDKYIHVLHCGINIFMCCIVG